MNIFKKATVIKALRAFMGGAVATLTAFSSVSLYADESPHKTLNLLYGIQGAHTLAGQHNKEPNANPLYYSTGVNTRTGKWPALHSGDFLFASADINNRQTMINQIIEQWNAGAVVNLMWHACSPAVASSCQWEGGVKGSLTDTQWAELITDGTTLNNTWKQRMDEVAVFLQQLEDAEVEVLFRPLHEMNQGAFWWGGRKGADGTARLYQITHDYLSNTKGLTNLIWVWNLQDFSTLATDVNDYDPGNEYWDILSLDMYWSDGKGYELSKYEAIRNKAAGKPIAIGEAEDLPSPSLFTSQPDWTFFMGWAELTFNNSDSKLNTIYGSERVISRDEMPGWSNASVQVTQAEDYSNMSGVEKVSSAEEGGEVVTSIDAWDWLSYPSFEAPEDGKYVVSFRVQTDSPVTLQLEEAGVGALATINVPSFAGKWGTVYKTINLTKGAHAFGVKSTEGTLSLNWFAVSPTHQFVSNVSSSSSSSFSSALSGGSYPFKIEAESYSNMDGVIKSTDVDGESTSVVSSFGAWEWMSYSAVNLPQAGDHVVSYRVKTSGPAVLQLEEAGEGVHGVLEIASTGGEWATVSHTISFESGSRAFGLKVTAGDISLNWFSIDCMDCSSASSSAASSELAASSSVGASSTSESSESMTSSSSSVDTSSSSSEVATSEVSSSVSSDQSSSKKSSGGGSMSLMTLFILFMFSQLFSSRARITSRR